MKRAIFYFIFLLTIGTLSAQNKTINGSFKIVDLADNSKLDFYTQAIENANFEQYRLVEQDLKITFENGFVLELFSAKKCLLLNKITSIGSYSTSSNFDQTKPVFVVNSDGLVLIKYTTKESKFKK
jgi:hypothetical protein